jgi:hypothetical protein
MTALGPTADRHLLAIERYERTFGSQGKVEKGDP